MIHKNGKTFPKILYFMIAILVAIAVIVFVLSILRRSSTNVISADIEEGLAFIKAQEEQNPIAIEDSINALDIDFVLADMDAKLQENPDYVWTALSRINTGFMGDSRTKAYETYGFVDASRCWGDEAMSIAVIPDHYYELSVANPKLLVIAYGLNDIGLYWSTAEEWAYDMMSYVDQIHEFLPDCKIYIQSNILPRLVLDESWPGIYDLSREWNREELAIFDEYGYDYIDVGDLVEEYAYLFMDDGVHLYAEFYPHLAELILRRYMTDTLAEGKAADLASDSEEYTDTEEYGEYPEEY